jgi:hypothetical protein
MQLAVTAASICFFGLNPNLSQWMSRSGSAGLAVPVLSLLLSTVTWFIMCISSDEQRRSKLKWTLLALFTTGEAISVGYLSSFFKFRSVLLAMLTTAVVRKGGLGFYRWNELFRRVQVVAIQLVAHIFLYLYFQF